MAYATTDKKIIYQSLNIKNKPKIINLELKDELQITELSWYTLDESYKYILVGISDGTVFLNEFVEGLNLMKFEKFGLGYLFFYNPFIYIKFY